MNLLIPNIGRRGYLVRYLKNTLGFDGKVFVSDCDNTASGLYGDNDGAFILPRPADDEEKYIDALSALCRKRGIGVIIPVIDPEISILSRYRDMLRKEEIFVSVSSADVLSVCYDKRNMNTFLRRHGFDFPATCYSVGEFETAYDRGQISFPVIIKPILGSGSVSTYRINTAEELRALFRDDMMIQEFIAGQEFGIDVFNNLEQTPVRCVVKKKLSMRSGETDKSVTVRDDAVQETAVRLASALGHICNLDCDVLVRDGRVYVIDLNPRFGGGYPATHEAGVNLLELVLQLAEGKPIAPDFNHYKTDLFVFKEVGIVSTRGIIV